MFGNRVQRAVHGGAKRVDRRRLMELAFAKIEAVTGAKRRRAYAYARAVQRNAARASA